MSGIMRLVAIRDESIRPAFADNEDCWRAVQRRDRRADGAFFYAVRTTGDLYGEHVFPLQVTVLLSAPDRDFTGGEFVLVEQRPRRQSRVEVVPLDQGDAVVFPVRHRPVPGARGAYRGNVRHGVSRVRSGHRHAAGIIFHDAE